MTVKISTESIYDMYLEAISDDVDISPEPSIRAEYFLGIFNDDIKTERTGLVMHDVKTVLNAILEKEVVKYVEPQYLAYIRIPENVNLDSDCVQVFWDTRSKVLRSQFSNTMRLNESKGFCFSYARTEEIRAQYPGLETEPFTGDEE